MSVRSGVFLLLMLAGCPGGPPAADEDAAARDAPETDPSEASPTVDADEETSRPADAEGVSGPGPLTHVADENLFVLDRLCDLDGDGAADNAFADLGPGDGPIAVAAFNSFLGAPHEAALRWLFHFPWLDDLGRLDDDDATLIFTLGDDTDDPRDGSDDFTGDEAFFVRPGSLDACGEPRSFFPSTTVEAGAVRTTRAGDLLLDIGQAIPIVARSGEISATLEPSGGGGEWMLCGALLIDDLGAAEVVDVDVGDLSMLEVMLGGGAALGLPAVPGVAPDLDLDGDGVERLVVDDESRITQCVDGDLSIIEGRDCWRDPRMVDAFALNMRFGTVPARLAGRPLGWEAMVDGSCDTPPETSLWDPR